MVFFVPFWEGGNIYSCSDMDYVKEYCLEVDAANYKCLYSDRMLESDDLDGLYATFNDNPPADYKVHSLSVSDVVIMHQNGETKAYYVDQFGFAELPDFAAQREKILDIVSEIENVDYENDLTCISFYAAECAEDEIYGLTDNNLYQLNRLNTYGLLCMCIPLYNETLRDCFTVGEKKKYQKIDDNGELVIE
jgi:hypothetical protein